METLCGGFDSSRNVQMEDGERLNFDGFKGFKVDYDAESLVKKWIKFLALLIESDRSSSVSGDSEDSEEEWILSTRRRKTKRVTQLKPPAKTLKHRLKDKLKQNKCKDSGSQSANRKQSRSAKKKVKPIVATETSPEQEVPKEQVIDTVLLISDSDEDSDVSLVHDSNNSKNLTVRVEAPYNSICNINSISLTSDDDLDEDDEYDGVDGETKNSFICNNSSISLSTDDDDYSEEETIKVNSLRKDGSSISLSTDDEDEDSAADDNSNGKISLNINETSVSNDKAISAIISNPSISLTPISIKSTSPICQPAAERPFEKSSVTDRMNSSSSLSRGQLPKFKQSTPKCISTCLSSSSSSFSSSIQVQKANSYTKNNHQKDVCARQLPTPYSKEVSFKMVNNHRSPSSNVITSAIRATTSAATRSTSMVSPTKAAATVPPEMMSSISRKVNENCSAYSANNGDIQLDESTIRLSSSVTITPKNRVKKLMKNYVKGSIARKYDKGRVYYTVNLANGCSIPLSDEEVKWLRSDNNGLIPSEITIPVSASVADSVEPIVLIDD